MVDLRRFEALIVEVLEDQAFLLGDPVPTDDLPETLAGCLGVELLFHGLIGSGSVALACSSELADELASNVLGLDGAEQTSSEDSEDALKELVNVVAGRALAILPIGDEVLELSPSKLTPDVDGSRWSQLRNSPNACALLVEDHPAIFVFNPLVK